MKPLDDGYRMLAAECLRKQSRRLGKQLKRIGKDDQIEIVHQARVAARRLSAGVRAFVPLLGKKRARRWQSALRSALRRLGEARDKDVQIDFIRRAMKAAPDKAIRPGLRRLLIRLQQRRTGLEPAVEKAARKLRKSGVLKAVRKRADKLAEDIPADGATIQTPRVFAVAAKRIGRRLARLAAFEPCLADAAQVEAHHEMRIAAKQLRYTMEIFRPAYAGKLDGHLSAVKKLQEMLGDIHDCDVWLDLLAGFIAKETKRAEKWYGASAGSADKAWPQASAASAARSIKRLQAGIEHFRSARQADRERIFTELGDYWRKLQAKSAFDNMTALLNETLAQAKARAEAQRAAAEAQRLAAEAAEAAARAERQADAAQAERKPGEADNESPPDQAGDDETEQLVGLVRQADKDELPAADEQPAASDDINADDEQPPVDDEDAPLGHNLNITAASAQQDVSLGRYVPMDPQLPLLPDFPPAPLRRDPPPES